MIDPTKFKPGGIVLDAPERVPAIWGHGSEVLWAEGEPLIIAGPPGVGKTSIAQQITLARCGVAADLNVLGYLVLPGEARSLYVAADRPKQALRSMRRMVRPSDRRQMDENLVIWEGPFDLLDDPAGLAATLKQQAIGTVVLDSIKDVAGDVTDSKVGSAFNVALQHLVSNDIEVLALHHPRKAQEGNRKPKKLDDLYGSMALGAGTGSVVYLYGQAGDLVVEALHLKQPAGEVGPLTVVHDHVKGSSTVLEAISARSVLEGVGEVGIEVKAAASAIFTVEKPTANQVEKTRRKLDALVRDRVAEKVESAEPKGASSYRLRDSRDGSRDGFTI